MGNTGEACDYREHADGSPPHPWGILVTYSFGNGIIRFTPTPVGNTTYADGKPYQGTVHPHTRGEYVTIPYYYNLYNQRFTPTPVGNTVPRCPDPPHLTVHPHTRGEYCWISTLSNPACGSPPHPWGILPSAWPTWYNRSVHPHTRGEYGNGFVNSGMCVTLRFTPTPVGNTRWLA